MSTRRSAALGLVCALLLAPLVHAAPPPPVQAEINYLLESVAKSGCEFYRNGSWHDSKQAVDHLRYKYDWLARHDLIKSTEDFIEKAATKSSLTGQAYEIRCNGGPVATTNAWLRIVLVRYRQSVAR